MKKLKTEYIDQNRFTKKRGKQLIIIIIAMIIAIQILDLGLFGYPDFIKILWFILTIICCFFIYKGSNVWKALFMIKLVIQIIAFPLLLYLYFQNPLNNLMNYLSEKTGVDNSNSNKLFISFSTYLIYLIFVTIIHFIILLVLLKSKSVMMHFQKKQLKSVN